MELVDTYKERLASKGIKIVLSKRYTETEVEDTFVNTDPRQTIFDILERVYRRKKEKEKGYNFEKNKYHTLVITVVPVDKKLISIEECREYAFFLKKNERAHFGEKPQTKSYQESEILTKIEKRILRILKKADKRGPQQLCKNTFWDAFRYVYSQKYEYKTKFCKKERLTWETIFIFLAVAIAVAVFVAVWAITKFV